jgi:tRNA threonylcarbamoyladenosine biosynthesis protein TsaB
MSNENIALAIDTSTRYATVGISRDGQSLVELAWRSEQNHSIELVPAIQRAMAQAHVQMNDISAIYTAIGPGGFSALRVGMSTAMAMAMARDIPVVAIGTLEIEAYPYLGLGKDITALIGAGRTRLYVGEFKSGEPLSSGHVSLTDREEFFDNLPRNVIYCGEAAVELREELKNQLGAGCQTVFAPPPTRSAGVIAQIGFTKLRSGETSDLSEIEPIYLRSSQVTSAARRWPGASRT